MKLYGTTTSPYARIARVVVFEKHLQITSNSFGLRHEYPTILFYLLILQVVCPFFFYQMVLG